MNWVDLGAADLPDGELRDGGHEVALARVGGVYVAFEVWCTHEECPLTDGWLEDAAVRCACHGALFALPSGEVLEGPAEEPIRVYETRVVDGRVEARISSES
jgi:nitrite reductase/ring-hydroxylating ferredoxin subunit